LNFSTIFLLDFATVSTVWYLSFSFIISHYELLKGFI